MTKIQASIAVALALTINGQIFAQTRVQCHIDDTGSVSAALIWQNTLGAERANGICRASISEGVRAQETRPDQSPQNAPVSANQLHTHSKPQPQPVQHSAALSQTNAQDGVPGSVKSNPALRADSAVAARSARTGYGGINRGRFEPGVYERAGVSAQTAPTVPANQPAGSHHFPAGNDYVPLDQAGRNSGDEGYDAIW